MFKEIKAKNEEYIMHTYGRVQVALDKGENATAWDVDGKRYIDFTSGIGVNALGYSDKGWVQAVTAQAQKIQHMCNYYYSQSNTELAQKLAEVSGFSRSFFCNSGAEANECAVKIARKYGESKNADKIITLVDSFHGRTITTLAATGQDSFHKDFLPLTEGFLYAERTMDSVKAVAADDVCAVMMEMVQGEGGVVPMEESFVKELRAFCDEKNILLIADEVQTGIGRTGRMFAYQGYGVMPDVITLAKGLGGGLPIGVCMVNNELKDLMQPGMNGSTFGANPVVCAGALEVLNRVSDDVFLAEVKGKSEYLFEELEKLSEVDFVRGKGLMVGIKLKNMNAHDVLVKCADRGLLILTAKDLVRLLPPLTITKAEIDEGLEIFKKVIGGME